MPSYYFAYGSNMSTAEMHAYCPSAICLGQARLDGWRLVFTLYSARRRGGVADIVKLGSGFDTPELDPTGLERSAPANCPLSPTWGVLWEVAASKLAALHSKEGYQAGRPREENVYDITSVEVLLAAKATQRVRAFAYEVVAKEAVHQPPNAGYMQLLLAGAFQHGFAADYRRALSSIGLA